MVQALESWIYGRKDGAIIKLMTEMVQLSDGFLSLILMGFSCSVIEARADIPEKLLISLIVQQLENDFCTISFHLKFQFQPIMNHIRLWTFIIIKPLNNVLFWIMHNDSLAISLMYVWLAEYLAFLTA